MTDEERQEAEAPEEEPQIYTVKKDMDGWQFNRRTFLTAAGATAAARALAGPGRVLTPRRPGGS